MSFDVVCPSCGAPSNPSAGICPYCKTVLSSGSRSHLANPTVDMIGKSLEEGHLPDALTLITTFEKENPKALDELPVVILYLRILFESEGPLSKINSLISSALLKFPNDATLHECLDLSKAKSLLNGRAIDAGLQALVSLVQRAPSNYLVLFTLGTGLHWEKKDEINAVKYLEKCVTLRPQFLRAWACLGVAYKAVGNQSLAARAFQKCLSLETDPQMKAYFQRQIHAECP